MFILVEPQSIQELRDLVHIVGIPSICGLIVWLTKAYMNGTQTLKAIDTRSVAGETALAQLRSTVDTVKDNHLQHMQEAITGLCNNQTQIGLVLTSMDKTLGILADRSSRGQMVVETKIRHLDPTDENKQA